MHLLWTVLIGFCVGVVAKFLMPGKDPGGFIITTLLGIGGAWVGSLLFGGRVGFLGSVVGAVVILILYRFVKGKSSS